MSSTKTEELMRAIGDCTEEMQLVEYWGDFKRHDSDWTFAKYVQHYKRLNDSVPWYEVNVTYSPQDSFSADKWSASISHENRYDPPTTVLQALGSSPNDALENLADLFQKEIQEAQAHV